jgi:RNA polymerase primary sigma factor
MFMPAYKDSPMATLSSPRRSLAAVLTTPRPPARSSAPKARRRVHRWQRSLATEPRWLRSEALAAAHAYWLQHRRPLACGAAELRRLTLQFLQTEIGFIGDPQFDDPAAAEAIFSQSLDLDPAGDESASGRKSRAAAAMPPHLAQLCQAKLLTPVQEALLFRRMNFLRHQAVKLRSSLDAQQPSRRTLERLEQRLLMAQWHRDRIVESNLRLVVSIVKKFVNCENAFDDLLSEGIVALMRAVDKFDVARGFKFSTYATQVVRRNAYRQVVEAHQERGKMIAGVDGMALDISDGDRQSGISEVRWHELRTHLGVLLQELDRREKFIIRARFSLGSHRRVHTLQSLADRLGVSKERVRQLERRAMEKLRVLASGIQLADLQPTA